MSLLNDVEKTRETLRNSSYLLERLQPQPGQHSYLHLSDLRLAVEGIVTSESIRILDYGCGGSPYKSLFPNADYRRADFYGGNENLDYTFGQDSRIEESSETFDFVLSTQVAEHVTNAELYFSECYRLLKKGGRLYLTTHGGYPDHGCPYDFRRWTADGLRLDLEKVGFNINRIEKQTTGARALFQEIDNRLGELNIDAPTLFGFLLRMAVKIYTCHQRWVHVMCDRHFQSNRVVLEALEAHPYYKVVGCLATK